MPDLSVNLKGRIKNLSLPASRPLAPLFEAIVNALHAIKSAAPASGRVDITVLREDAQAAADLGDGHVGPVTGFIVTDNGIGFDGDNYQSFLTSDSTFKESIGGKGVGRLLWLKAFESVFVDSCYREGDAIQRRAFSFDLSKGIQDVPPTGSPAKTIGSRIELRRLREQYQRTCPKRVETISEKIAEHVLGFLLDDDAPKIVVTDGAAVALVNDTIGKELVEVDSSGIGIGVHEFRARHFKIYSPEARMNRLHFCANGREVKTENLGLVIPSMRGVLHEPDGRPFVWSTFITGKLLDENVSPERGEFTIPESKSELGLKGVSLSDIRDLVVSSIKVVAKPVLDPIRAQKKLVVEKFVADVAPQYRTLVKRRPELVEELAADASEDKLDAELRRLQFQEEQKLRDRSKHVLEAVDVNTQEWESVVEDVTEFGKSELAKYVLSRRRILDLFQKSLGTTMSGAGKHELEAAVHRLIVPLKSTSDDVPYDKLNLWIIDESLAYHYFLASDKPLSSVAPLENSSGLRPDLLVFNRPLAMAGESQMPFGSIVIVEFKRPARNEYEDNENPLMQILGYITAIRAGKAKDRDGNLITVSPEIPFYCYVICDLTLRMREFAVLSSLTPGPDGMSYFGYIQGARAYVEVASFHKIVKDARERNKVFFDKLGL